MKAPISIVIGIVKNSAGEIFITRRSNTLHQGGLWEFAGGKVERGETLEIALARELKEEIGIEMIAAKPLISLSHEYSDCAVKLHVFSIVEYEGEAQSRLNQEWAWVNIDNLENYAFPAANKAILTACRLPPHYAILNDDTDDLLLKLNALLTQGVTLIQARLKNLTASEARKFLEIAYPLCQSKSAWLLVNSGTANAFDMPSDGIHLTSGDLLALDSRPENLRWLAASCHNQAELEHAEKIGVDFAVLAPIMKTTTHPETIPLGWAVFSEWINECNVPIYALGGMKKTDLETAQFHGGQGIAGIQTFFETQK
ncbi:MAG: Nudix family hydrolase [Methylococcaceae bacterium]